MIFLFKIIACLFSYSITYYLNNTKQLGPVKASALIALPVGIMYQLSIYYSVETELMKDFAAIMMGATFMGMISNKHAHQFIDFTISAIIFCTLYQHTSSFFNGFGGLLGTIACISILCVFGIERILAKINKP